MLLQVILEGVEQVTPRQISHAQWPKWGTIFQTTQGRVGQDKLLHVLSKLSRVFRINIYLRKSTRGFVPLHWNLTTQLNYAQAFQISQEWAKLSSTDVWLGEERTLYVLRVRHGQLSLTNTVLARLPSTCTVVKQSWSLPNFLQE